MIPLPRRCTALAAIALSVTGLTVGLGLIGPSAALAAAPTTTKVSPTGSVTVQARGNGHGHGMSQYGAEGAAEAGLNYRQILAFYYRHTTLTTMGHHKIRVLLSGYGKTTTVAAKPALTVTGIDSPLSTSPAYYRLVAGSADTLTLQQKSKGAHASWTTLRTGLPDKSAFHAVDWSPIQIFSPDHTSALYYGLLRAVRTGSGVETVNRVSLDHYTAGVAPREMPASWQPAAVRAQAVAARTYGMYAVLHPRSSDYDICDTTMCQVYGGYQQRNAQNQVTVSDDLPVAAATSNQVLTYQGEPIFAQFSASNGGWEDSGGEPYLVSQRDPYDTAKSGDPYDALSEKVSSSSIAAYFGLSRLTAIAVTGRDGNGTWGGRVETVTLTGKNADGDTRKVHAQGYDLQYALGLGTTLFSVSAAHTN